MKKANESELNELTDMLVKFRDARNWEQFHNSKDLALAMSIEAAELNELFLWKTPENVNVDKLKEELADVFIYALLLAKKHEFNVSDIVKDKIRLNDKKYPADKARNTAKKYHDL